MCVCVYSALLHVALCCTGRRIYRQEQLVTSCKAQTMLQFVDFRVFNPYLSFKRGYLLLNIKKFVLTAVIHSIHRQSKHSVLSSS